MPCVDTLLFKWEYHIAITEYGLIKNTVESILSQCPTCNRDDIPCAILNSHIHHCADEQLEAGKCVQVHCMNYQLCGPKDGVLQLNGDVEDLQWSALEDGKFKMKAATNTVSA